MTEISRQQFLACITEAPEDEWNRLQPATTLSKHVPDVFGDEDSWMFWVPFIPRVGDVLMFSGWWLKVVNVGVPVDFNRAYGKKPTSQPDVYLKVSFHSDKDSDPKTRWGGSSF